MTPQRERKLAELWMTASGNYYLKVEVSVEHAALVANAELAQHVAQTEVIEVLRNIVDTFDNGEQELVVDGETPP